MTVAALHLSGHRDMQFPCSFIPSLCNDNVMTSFRRTCSAPCSLTISGSKGLPWNSLANGLSGRTSPALLKINSRCEDVVDPLPAFSRSKSCGGIDPAFNVQEISRFFRFNDDTAIPSSSSWDVTIPSEEPRAPSHVISRTSSSEFCSSSTEDHTPEYGTHRFIDDDFPSHRRSDELELATWNLASPNNNPFEFWVIPVFVFLFN
jgi:hypothetical protein